MSIDARGVSLWYEGDQLTGCKGLVSSDFHEEAVELLHVLECQIRPLTARLFQRLIDVFEQHGSEFRIGGESKDSGAKQY